MPPKSLSDPIARAEWIRMVERMRQSKTMTLVDDGALYQYSQLFAETERIAERGRENRALTTKLMKAMNKLNGDALVAAVTEIVKLRTLEARTSRELRQGHMAIRGYLIEFGMTPAARTRVKIPRKSIEKPAGQLVAFMGGKASQS